LTDPRSTMLKWNVNVAEIRHQESGIRNEESAIRNQTAGFPDS
jgi:hypothetical protein